MFVKRIVPRGYCHGVVSAINMVADTLKDETIPRPIYIIGQVIHNKKVTDAFTQAGAITLDGKTRADIINKVNSGTIIITAHGIDANLIISAKERGLNVVDATCSDVYKTHDLIKQHLRNGYDIFYIGQQQHPETEAVLAIDKKKIHLVEKSFKIDDIKNVESKKIMVTNQTTMSIWDVNGIVEMIREKYPNALIHNEVCNATQLRQEAVLEATQECELIIVVGDTKSNNTNKLVEVSEINGKTPALRVEDIFDLDLERLKDVNVVGVTAGASTPSILTKQICDFLDKFNYEDKSTWVKPLKISNDRLIPRI